MKSMPQLDWTISGSSLQAPAALPLPVFVRSISLSWVKIFSLFFLGGQGWARTTWNKFPHSFYLASWQHLQLLTEEARAVSKHENTNHMFKCDCSYVLLKWFGHIVQINLLKRAPDILKNSEKLCKNNKYKLNDGDSIFSKFTWPMC